MAQTPGLGQVPDHEGKGFGHPAFAFPEGLDGLVIAGVLNTLWMPPVMRLSYGLLGGQDVFTVATMQDKLDAQLRGLGSGGRAAWMPR